MTLAAPEVEPGIIMPDACSTGSISIGSATPLAGVADNLETGPKANIGVRLRAGGVVLRRGETASQPEVLLVSRRRAPGSFTVPAGKFEQDVDGGSFEACALRETQEEAGMECNILFDLGWYKGLSKDASETRTRFFAMQALQEVPHWCEESERVRCWKGLAEAQQLTSYSPVLAEVFGQLAKDLEEGKEGSEALLGKQGLPKCNSACSSQSGQHIRRSTSTASMSSTGSSLAQSLQLPETETLDNDVPVMQSERSEAPSEPVQIPRERSRSGSVPGLTRNQSMRKLSLEATRIEDVDGERFRFYGNQVGGHFCLVKPAPESVSISIKPNGASGSVEILLPSQEVVLKPLEEQEHRFYKQMIKEVPDFVPHMPKHFGTKTLTHRQVSAMTAEVDELVKTEENFLETRMRSHQFQTYIVMEDLASSMLRPRILDLKMGYKQRSKQHSQRKKERCRMKAANSTSHALGFRICGFSTETTVHDKYWGRKLPVVDMQSALADFFLHENASTDQRQTLVTQLLSQVNRLHEVISQMRGWRFWNTSLLFLFDGGDLSKPADMRLIDFAHCTCIRGSEPDAEFLCGLQNIRTFLEAVRDGHPYELWIRERLADPPDAAVQDREEDEPFDEAESTRCRDTATLPGGPEPPAVAAAG